VEVREGAKNQSKHRADCRAGESYDDFLDWTFWDAFETRQSSNRQKGDIRGADPETAGGPSVPKLVEQNTGKHEAKQRDSSKSLTPSSGEAIAQADPGKKNEKRQVNPDLDACETPDWK